MIRKYFLPVLAIAGMVMAVYTVVAGSQPIPAAEPVALPASAPFESYVAGAGIVEASTENIAVGASVAGVVEKVLVQVGDKVQAGQPLLQIDDRELQAELVVRKAALQTAQQQLARLRSLPRPEDIPPAEARVVEAQAALDEARLQREMREQIAASDARAISRDELIRRRSAVDVAEARLKAAQAELDLLKAGTWKEDLAVAQANVDAAQASVRAAEINIDRLTIRAPVDGQVLQVKVRVGEYAPAGVLATPLMLVGGTQVLHVRVDVDENDAWRIRRDAPAQASLRGNRDLKTDLKFVRIEPYVVPKRSLTGESNERVDTRVLQLIYAFDGDNIPVYVGQQMDVFIQAPSVTAALAAK